MFRSKRIPFELHAARSSVVVTKLLDIKSASSKSRGHGKRILYEPLARRANTRRGRSSRVVTKQIKSYYMEAPKLLSEAWRARLRRGKALHSPTESGAGFEPAALHTMAVFYPLSRACCKLPHVCNVLRNLLMLLRSTPTTPRGVRAAHTLASLRQRFCHAAENELTLKRLFEQRAGSMFCTFAHCCRFGGSMHDRALCAARMPRLRPSLCCLCVRSSHACIMTFAEMPVLRQRYMLNSIGAKSCEPAIVAIWRRSAWNSLKVLQRSACIAGAPAFHQHRTRAK